MSSRGKPKHVTSSKRSAIPSDPSSSQPASPPAKSTGKPACRFFLRGDCRLAEACPHPHPEPRSHPSAPLPPAVAPITRPPPPQKPAPTPALPPQPVSAATTFSPSRPPISFAAMAARAPGARPAAPQQPTIFPDSLARPSLPVEAFEAHSSQPSTAPPSSSSSTQSSVDELSRCLTDQGEALEKKGRIRPFCRRGLPNNGNKCFANASVQALLACEPFYNWLVWLAEIKRAEIPAARAPCLRHLARLAAQFVSLTGRESGGPVVPSALTDVLCEMWEGRVRPGRQAGKAGRGGLMEQEDAHEFLLFLLNKLHEETVQASAGAAAEEEQPEESQWETKGKRNRACKLYVPSLQRTAVSDIFGYQMRVTVHKDGRGKDSGQVEPISLFLSMSVDPSKATQSLEHVLHYALQPDRLEGLRRSGGASNVSGHKRTAFESLPRILMIHLRRFGVDELGPYKLHCGVQFAHQFIIPEAFLAHKLVAPAPASRTYRLFSLISHFGDRLGSGHYVTDALIGDAWFCFDDARVSAVTPASVLSRSKTVYLLFFQRH